MGISCKENLHVNLVFKKMKELEHWIKSGLVKQSTFQASLCNSTFNSNISTSAEVYTNWPKMGRSSVAMYMQNEGMSPLQLEQFNGTSFLPHIVYKIIVCAKGRQPPPPI